MESTESLQYKKMTETPVSKLIISLGIPTTISMLVTNIYNLADTYFVGQIGTSASGAVGVVFGLMAILQAFGFMFGHGAGSIISRKLGARDVKSATRFASTSFFLSLAVGTLIGMLGLAFTDPLMRILGSTETILPYSRIYGMYILIAAPFMTASCVLNNILRYEGRAMLAMIGLTAGGILNMIGDPILMFGFGLGIHGAGLSTAISQTISFFILLFMFLSGKTQSKLIITRVTRDIKEVLEIIGTGFPSLIRQGLNSVSTMILNQRAGFFGGDAAVAAMSIVNRICFFAFAVGLGIGQGFQPVSAFNYGAGKYSRVKKGFYFTWLAGEFCLGLVGIAGLFMSGNLIGFFRSDPEVIRIGTFALRAQILAILFEPFAVCGNMMLQSVGRKAGASFLAALRSGLYFIPVLILLSMTLGLTGVAISQTVADILTCITTVPFVIHFFRNLPADV
ncbi:MAG: MATE family efflux transporter [Lachnospiraceae bacterium]|nr:MATE family efflux transporter [Lachnospiraceae bacterium]